MPSNHAACIALLALVPACFHVTLERVPRSASGERRIAAYQRLRPASQTLTVTVQRNQHGVSVNQETSMVLADGTDVHHADDLLPVVDAATPSARAARRSRGARYARWFFAVTGGVSLLGGAFVALEASDGENADSSSMTYVGIGLAAAGVLMVMASQFYFAPAEEHARRAAFATYDASLQQSLRVCVDGLQVIDCKAAAPGVSTAR